MRPDEIVFVAFVLFVLGLLGLMFYSLLLRYRRRELQHKERLAALEKGMPLPELHEERRAPWSPQTYLLRGMIWLFSGIAIILFLGALSQASHTQVGLEERLYRDKSLREQGATEEQIKQYDTESRRDGIPFAFALLGLIPSGVGLAYLIFYRVQGTTLVAVSRQEV
jgi:hypothetical protein